MDFYVQPNTYLITSAAGFSLTPMVDEQPCTISLWWFGLVGVQGFKAILNLLK